MAQGSELRDQAIPRQQEQGHQVVPGAGCAHVVETAGGFVIRNPAQDASPPAAPDPISRAVNSIG